MYLSGSKHLLLSASDRFPLSRVDQTGTEYRYSQTSSRRLLVQYRYQLSQSPTDSSTVVSLSTVRSKGADRRLTGEIARGRPRKDDRDKTRTQKAKPNRKEEQRHSSKHDGPSTTVLVFRSIIPGCNISCRLGYTIDKKSESRIGSPLIL